MQDTFLNEIEKSLEKYLPRKYTKSSLEKVLGPVRYELDVDAINKAVNMPVWDFLDRGGKRWRPILFLTILEVLGKNPKDFIDLSVIFELIHNGTIIVDDFEDLSLKRRGKPTLHLIYGEDVAINAGNLIYFLPLKILDEYQNKLSSDQLLKVYQTYIDEMTNLGIGQATDIAWHRGLVNGFKITEGQYLQMCAFKTGGLSRMACKIAAITGGADEKLVSAFGLFGESLGIVFQIQDDILNIKKSELSDKKGLGDDITEGKRSLPVIFSLKNLPKAKGQKLEKILLMHTTQKKLIDEAIDLINQGEGIEKSRIIMEKLFNNAWKKLNLLLTEDRKKDKLLKLAKFLIEREI
ncbi:MAG: geranylgeranyl diphosphate synthase, type I [Microgenomates group bacterium Gr01-1014_93]|nr:MAG: geranylgeranyl diphosphate synthase, type I [Microgenomates group bacterium Gr01-1014_93]